MRALLLAAALAGLVGPVPVFAQSVRERALSDLARSADAGVRRAAVQRLADAGVMADLPALATALRDPDPLVRGFVESAMWSVWSRSGDAEVDRLFAVGVEQLGLRQLDAAIDTLTRVIQRRPEFAEGWNKRATAYYLMGDLDRSLADCEEVVKRNPAHFGALSGFGLIYLQKDDLPRAAEYFEKALAVDPTLIRVEAALLQIREVLRQRRQQTI